MTAGSGCHLLLLRPGSEDFPVQGYMASSSRSRNARRPVKARRPSQALKVLGAAAAASVVGAAAVQLVRQPKPSQPGDRGPIQGVPDTALPAVQIVPRDRSDSSGSNSSHGTEYFDVPFVPSAQLRVRVQALDQYQLTLPMLVQNMTRALAGSDMNWVLESYKFHIFLILTQTADLWVTLIPWVRQFVNIVGDVIEMFAASEGLWGWFVQFFASRLFWNVYVPIYNMTLIGVAASARVRSRPISSLGDVTNREFWRSAWPFAVHMITTVVYFNTRGGAPAGPPQPPPVIGQDMQEAGAEILRPSNTLWQRLWGADRLLQQIRENPRAFTYSLVGGWTIPRMLRRP